MKDRLPRSLILVPAPVSGDLIRLLEDWVAAWVVDPLMVVVLGDGSISEDQVTPDVTARVIGRDLTVNVDLLDELGERPSDLLRVVAITIDEALLGVDASGMRDEARRVKRMLSRSASTHNRVSSVNLIVAETQAVGLVAERLLMPSWNVNVLASTENRTGLRSFDAFVRRSRMNDLNGFAVAHAVTLAGMWSGMQSAPYDDVERRLGPSGVDLQRVSVRGVIAQDFMVQMARQGLELLVQEDTPLRDPTIRSQLSEQQQAQLRPIPDERADEAVAMLTTFVLDDIDRRPLRYRPFKRSPYQRVRASPWKAIRSFGSFTVDKFARLPSWFIYRVRSGFSARTGQMLHGAGGDELIEVVKDPFGDAKAFESDIAGAVAARQRGLDTLARPPAVTADGPDSYAYLWTAFRESVFQLLDGGSAAGAPGFTERFKERKLEGTIPNVSLICPDARDPWSPHPDVAALLEAETRELPLTVTWLDMANATRWADVLEVLAATYDDRVAAVETARGLIADELAELAERLLRHESDIEAVEALLALDEHDLGPILDALIAAALAGVDPEVRAALVHDRAPDRDDVSEDAEDTEGTEDEAVGAAMPDGVDSLDDEREDSDEPSEAEREPASEVAPDGSRGPTVAFDRPAAEAWAIALRSEQEQVRERRESLVEQAEGLAAQRELLEQVHPLVTDDLLSLRAWRWRLQRSFAGAISQEIDVERMRLESDFSSAAATLERDYPELEPQGSLYGQFVRRLTLGLSAAFLLARFLWEPILDRIGVQYGEGSALVAGALGVPAYPFILLFFAVLVWASVSYHRKWSARSRLLSELRHDLREMSAVVHHLQLEWLRTAELHRQAREMLRILSEVIHRPFLMDGITESLPSSRSLDSADLPKVVRFARPEVDEGWSGEIQFTQRILKSQLRRGWRSDAYAQLLDAIQKRHGVVRGVLDGPRADRDPVVRTAVLEYLLLDEAQRDAGMLRMRSALDDILSWSGEINFPYPDVRVIREDRDPVDIRTDMFEDEELPPEPWEEFLSADAITDERWAPKTFATGHARDYMDQRVRFVHAPPRLHARARDARTIEPRSDVRPVEIVVRIDVLPDPMAIDRAGFFGELSDHDEDGYAAREPHGGAVADDVAAESAGSGASSEGSASDADEPARFNF